jgi:hypothetical protein
MYIIRHNVPILDEHTLRDEEGLLKIVKLRNSMS